MVVQPYQCRLRLLRKIFHVTFLLFPFFPLGIYAIVKFLERTNPWLEWLNTRRIVFLGICSMSDTVPAFQFGHHLSCYRRLKQPFALDPGTNWSPIPIRMMTEVVAVSEHRALCGDCGLASIPVVEVWSPRGPFTNSMDSEPDGKLMSCLRGMSMGWGVSSM